MKQWLKTLTDQNKNYTCSWPTVDYGGANDQSPYTGKRPVISNDYDQFHQALLMTLYNSLHL